MVKELRAVRINAKHMKELRELSKHRGETVSFLMQQAVREFLERQRRANVNK
jgi:predicted transcriptional regulator